MWSSHMSKPYMSLTLHYVDTEWNLQNKTAYLPDNHAAEIITQALVEALATWRLSEDCQAKGKRWCYLIFPLMTLYSFSKCQPTC